jgi:hypothetical protein
MKASGILLVAILLMSLTAHAQREVEEGSSWTERVYFGGGFGLNSGTTQGIRYTFVALNPVVGYMVTQKFSMGTGLTWQHYRYSDFNKTTIDQYGVSPFARRNFEKLFAYAEYNLINTPTFNNTTRKSFDRMLLGLGYAQPIGPRSSINAMALYDVMYDNQERAFASPWVFRVFFSF